MTHSGRTSSRRALAAWRSSPTPTSTRSTATHPCAPSWSWTPSTSSPSWSCSAPARASDRRGGLPAARDDRFRGRPARRACRVNRPTAQRAEAPTPTTAGAARPSPLGRTVAGLVLDHACWEASAGAGRGERLRAPLRQLSVLGLHVAVTGGPADGHRDTPGWSLPGPGRLLLVPEATSPVEAALRWLDHLGVVGELVLVVGAPTTPDTLLALLEEQVHRAESQRVPGVHRDPRWTLVEQGVDPARHRVTESLFTLASGGVGFRGAVEEAPGHGEPLVVAAGVYDGSAAAGRAAARPRRRRRRTSSPRWPRTSGCSTCAPACSTARRWEPGTHRPPAPRCARCASPAPPCPACWRCGSRPRSGRLRASADDGTTRWSATSAPRTRGIGALTRQSTADDGTAPRSVQRLVAIDASPRGPGRRARAAATARRPRPRRASRRCSPSSAPRGRDAGSASG